MKGLKDWVFYRTKSTGGLKQLKEAGLVDYESCRGRVSALVFWSTLAPRFDPQRFSLVTWDDLRGFAAGRYRGADAPLPHAGVFGKGKRVSPGQDEIR